MKKKEYLDELLYDEYGYQDYCFGDMFYICNFSECEDEIYYLPVVVEKSIKNVIVIINTDEGYTFNINDDYVEELNTLDAQEKCIIAYSYGNRIILENDEKEEIIYISTQRDSDWGEYTDYLNFSQLSFEEKKEEYIDRKKNCFPYVTDKMDTDKLCNVKLKTYLTLVNPQGQGHYGLCWAASVATIVNYSTSYSTVSAIAVASRMGIDYNAGATIFQSQSALSLYGVNYNFYNSDLSWAKIKKNINNDKPIFVSAFNYYSNGHAGVIYGYYGTGDNHTVRIWDPNGNNGAGKKNQVLYSDRYKIMVVDNYPYEWQLTLAKYGD